jgi:hypothetical protein
MVGRHLAMNAGSCYFNTTGGRMNRAKLKQAVHFICATAKGLPLGLTRLYKILWFVEKESFLTTLTPILEIEFVKGKYGPMPPVALEVCSELQEDDKICMTTLQKGAYQYVDLQSLREPDTSLLSEHEMHFIKNLTFEICTEYTARGISDLTHNDIYGMLSMGERYPIELALVEKTRQPSPDEIASMIKETAECEA